MSSNEIYTVNCRIGYPQKYGLGGPVIADFQLRENNLIKRISSFKSFCSIIMITDPYADIHTCFVKITLAPDPEMREIIAQMRALLLNNELMQSDNGGMEIKKEVTAHVRAFLLNDVLKQWGNGATEIHMEAPQENDRTQSRNEMLTGLRSININGLITLNLNGFQLDHHDLVNGLIPALQGNRSIRHLRLLGNTFKELGVVQLFSQVLLNLGQLRVLEIVNEEELSGKTLMNTCLRYIYLDELIIRASWDRDLVRYAPVQALRVFLTTELTYDEFEEVRAMRIANHHFRELSMPEYTALPAEQWISQRPVRLSPQQPTPFLNYRELTLEEEYIHPAYVIENVPNLDGEIHWPRLNKNLLKKLTLVGEIGLSNSNQKNNNNNNNGGNV